MNYPEEIESTFLELSSFDERINAKVSKINALEQEITLHLTTQQDGNGKLLLTNDKMRSAAVAKGLAESEEFAEMANDLSNLRQDRIRLQARLERLRSEFKLHLLDCEQRNSIAAMKVADALWHARVGQNHHFPVDVEVELPF